MYELPNVVDILRERDVLCRGRYSCIIGTEPDSQKTDFGSVPLFMLSREALSWSSALHR